MSISFTGFKNASTLKIIDISAPNEKYMYSFTTQLTDDFNGKDLSNFRELRTKQQKMHIPNLSDKRFVNISFIKNDDNNKFIAINGEMLEPRRDTLGIYSFIGKLTQKIKETPEENFIINSRYVKSSDFDEMAIPGYNLRDTLAGNYDEIVDSLFYPENIKSQTEDIFQGVQEIMLDYLA